MAPLKLVEKVSTSVPGAGAKKLLQSLAPVPVIIPLAPHFPLVGVGVPPVQGRTTACIDTSSLGAVPPV
jgi:hypothetical protein